MGMGLCVAERRQQLDYGLVPRAPCEHMRRALEGRGRGGAASFLCMCSGAHVLCGAASGPGGRCSAAPLRRRGLRLRSPSPAPCKCAPAGVRCAPVCTHCGLLLYAETARFVRAREPHSHAHAIHTGAPVVACTRAQHKHKQVAQQERKQHPAQTQSKAPTQEDSRPKGSPAHTPGIILLHIGMIYCLSLCPSILCPTPRAPARPSPEGSGSGFKKAIPLRARTRQYIWNDPLGGTRDRRIKREEKKSHFSL